MEEEKTLKEVKALGRELLSSRAHINNLPVLLGYISPQRPPPYVLESLLSLQSFFTPLLPGLPPSTAKPNHNQQHDDAPLLIYRTWLRSKFDHLLTSLFLLLLSPQADPTLREIVFDSIMEFAKLGNAGKFHSAIYHKLLLSLVRSESSVDFLLDSLSSKYFKYINIRYFTYISLEKIASTLEATDHSDHNPESDDKDTKDHSRERKELFTRRVYFILSHIPALENLPEDSHYELWSGSVSSLVEDETKAHAQTLPTEKKKPKTEQQKTDDVSTSKMAKRMKLKFTKAWISFLRLHLPVDVYKEVLVGLHQAVMPHLNNPKILCDFLTRSYDIGGVVSVMALSSLYILIVEHGLEYPNFYEKLYALLLPSIFLAKHRAKFFQLLDSCLKSPLLPAYLAAAFAKKLSRLSLCVPPSGALVITALIHNLLRRHPSINCLVHQLERSVAQKNAGVSGPVLVTTLSELGSFLLNLALSDMCMSFQEDDVDNVETRSDVDRESHGNATDSAEGRKQIYKPGIDHFNNEESNLLKSNALRSSLWEMDSLRHHYCPLVSRFVRSLENDLTVRAKTTEVDIKDFSSASYGTIFGNEMRRRVKQVPLAFYKATPTCLFAESDFVGWSFQVEEATQQQNTKPKRQRVEC